LLGLASFIAGFALLAVDRPEPGMELHQARVEGDEQYRDLLEDELSRRQLWRRISIGALLTCGALFTAAGFLAMQPARPPRKARTPTTKADRPGQ
jgi:hypothetical protein